MTLPATADRLDDLPEAIREHYVATEDGRFRLDAEGVEDVAGLKSALEKERAARKAQKAETAEPVADPRVATLQARLIEAEARAALQAARGVPELLLPVLRDRLAVADDGAVRVAGDEALSIADLVEGLRADPAYGRAFEGSGKAGSGAPTAGRGEAGPLTVSAGDPRAVSRHVADIAAGRVLVA